MNKWLLGALKQPELYQKSSDPFWDDEYISEQMLKAHLSQDMDAASRRLDFIDRSVEWIGAYLPAAQYPHLLDLGCGPGLYCERFKRLGYDVTGFDLSQRSIDYARNSAAEKGLQIKYECRNYLELNEPERYDLCTMIYCDYGALSTEDRHTVLRNINALLKPDGVFLFDVFTRSQYRDFTPSKTWELHGGNGFWRREPHAEIYEGMNIAPDVYCSRHVILTENKSSEYLIWDTVFDEKTITAELNACGFTPTAFFGDVSGSELTGDCNTMAVVCKKTSGK